MTYGTPNPDKKISENPEIAVIEEFGKALVKAMKALPNPREDLEKKILKVPVMERESITFLVPAYARYQAAYAVQTYIQKNAQVERVTCFDDNYFSPPEFENIEVKRGVRESILTSGYTFFTYKDVGFKAMSYYCGTSAYTTFTFPREQKDKAFELVENIRTFMETKNYFKGEKLKLTKGVFLDFLDYPKVKWDELILPQELKDEIALNIIFPVENEKLCAKYKVPWRRGVLLGGVPGTGKTKLAKILCNMLEKCTVIWVSGESISEPYHVEALFQAAREFAPTLIVMEDIDVHGKDREYGDSAIIGELLNQLDGNAPNNGIFVLASTNRPNLLDKALANRPGRFDIKLEVKLPDATDREKLVRLFSQDKTFDKDVSLQTIVSKTEGFTGAHIQEIFSYAALDSLKKGHPAIKQASLEKALERLRPKQTNVMSQ